ncbi:uncharacterized protein LOC144862138 [Branchiostoma floridae x Branchiostoma japonicum]
METGPCVVLLHAAEDGEFVKELVENMMDLRALGHDYSLPQRDISCHQVTGTPGDVIRAQLTSTLTLGSVKLVVPVISRHLLADQSSLTVGLETAVRNNKPRYVIWLDQNKDDFREFGTLVSRQYPTLEAPARRVQRDRVEETMPGSGYSGMEGIAEDVRDALCRQTGELRFPCSGPLDSTRLFLADNMNLPAVLTRLEQENQLSPAEVRDIQAEPTPVSRGERLVNMLRDRRRQEPYDWLVRVLREEGQDFLAEEMEERERHWERVFGIGEQQAAQPGQQTAQTEHFTQQSQVTMQKHIRLSGSGTHADDVTTLSEIKCVILGQTEAGKTSLLNCMMKGRGHVETETDRTIGVDVITYHDTKNNVKYEMYDFGGHQIYHYTHRFFLTRQALHILNVDLPEYKSEEFQERVGTWLTSVTSHVFNPAILVVGTKVDLFPPDKAKEMIAAACSSIQRDIQAAESKIQTKLNEEIQLCQKAVDGADGGSDLTGPFYGLTRDDILAKKESLEKLLDGRPKGLLNVQVIPVSSKTFQGIEALCDKMAEMVKDERLFPTARQELPTSWKKLSENIKTSGRPYLHVRDCQDVGAAAGMKESDVLNALSYLHVTGQILFYNHIRGMEDLVFPDPTIILILFKQIFRHDLPAYLDSIAESLSEHTRPQFAEDRASFLKTGRAGDSFMKNLLGDNIATFNSLLPLMKHFGLCYSGSVIFPTELPAAQPDEVARCWPEVVPSGGEEISVTIEYSQEPPLGLPETMVSRILSMEQTTRRLLTKDTVVVHVGENSEDVMYHHFPTREEIRIRGEPEKAWRQAQTVAKVMEACWDEFPALYFSNSVGSGETAKSLTIEAVRRHVPVDLLRMSEGNWERPADFTANKPSEGVIGKYFIDNRLYQVSRAIGEERQLWTRLGQELGLNRTVLGNIDGGYKHQYTQQAFQMLKAWRTKTPHGPLHYLPQLEETLQNMGKSDLAADVQGVYRDYRDALPLQKVSPEIAGDTQCTGSGESDIGLSSEPASTAFLRDDDHEPDSESQMLERLADKLDEENVQQLLQVCLLSNQLKREMQNSQQPRDLLKAMVKLEYIKVDNLTMLRKDMITAGISWNAVVRNVTGAIYLRQQMVEESDIGPSGGAVEIPHFIELVVPADALQQNTKVTLSTVDFPSLLIRSNGVHWSSDYPWSHAEAACSREMLGKVLFSPAFHVNLHGAKLTGKVPVEVQTWRPSGTEDHKCIILHHDDINGWKDISSEAKLRETEDRLVISLSQCSTTVPIWVPLVLFSTVIAAATSSPALAPVVLGTAAAVKAGEYLVTQMLNRSKEGTLKCWFSAYMKPANKPDVQFHVLCKDGVSQGAFPYREGFVHCGDNRSQVCLFNGEYIDVHVKDASSEHEKTVKSVIVDEVGCRSQWGQQVQLILLREKFLIGEVTIKRNKGTQDVCSMTFEQRDVLPQRQYRLDQLSESNTSQSGSRPSGGPSDHPLQEQGQAAPSSGRCSVLLVSTEYGTSKGGISTINRKVARMITNAGAKVYATVLEASQQDERDAKRDGVKLLKPHPDLDSSAKPSLEWLTVYHSVHFPHIPSDVCCIVGHVDVTSRAARKIKEERFPHAKLAMFGHVAPEETEHYKSDEKALGVGRKEASIQDDIGKADVVFSVGPRIHRHYDRFLSQSHVAHHIFLPEPSKVFSEAKVTFGEEDEVEKPERVVLSIGRVRNVEMLKGHDLAAGAIDKAAQRLDNQYTMRLRVRGIDENDFKKSKRILEEKLRSGRVKPTLLPYGTQEEIRRDMENCHLVLMPSRAEPFGLVGLEAIAAGVPVLISEQSGLAELVAQLAKKYQHKFRDCIVKMKGDTVTDAEEEKWAEKIEDFLTNARSEFAEAHTFREKLLASKYWEESHQTFLQACGITATPSAKAEGGEAEADDST